LNIKGHKTLNDSLQEFLKEEHLTGDDKYYCDHCDSKQDAVRKICLITLPPVLNIQLMRFVYDRYVFKTNFIVKCKIWKFKYFADKQCKKRN
jgi:ubiquitin C-terminal hydrolase